MRVIAGEKRHLLLKSVEGFDIRPTTDKIKETLFNVIQFDIGEKYFLDLFAGTGAIGIEALSRGSKYCTFVDNNIKAIKVIKENVEHTDLTKKCEIIQSDALVAISRLENKNITYGIVFIDPPYDNEDIYQMILEKLSSTNIITKDTIVIIEAKNDFDNTICENLDFEIYKEKNYKNNKHLFMKRKK